MCMSPDYAIVIVLVVQNVYIQKWTKICILYIFLNPLIYHTMEPLLHNKHFIYIYF